MSFLGRLKIGKRGKAKNEVGISAQNSLNHSSSSATATRNAVTPSTLVQTSKLGLILLNPGDGSSPVDNENMYSLDIVALHGLNGDPYSTWTHKDGKLWLRDFIPNEFPGARVFTFGYDANVFLSLATSDLRDFGRSLLEKLRGERREKESSLPRQRNTY